MGVPPPLLHGEALPCPIRRLDRRGVLGVSGSSSVCGRSLQKEPCLDKRRGGGGRVSMKSAEEGPLTDRSKSYRGCGADDPLGVLLCPNVTLLGVRGS